MKRLIILAPRWFAEPGRYGQGVVFLCPCCQKMKLAIAFANPIDGLPPIAHLNQKRNIAPLIQAIWGGEDAGDDVVPPGAWWQRTGETFSDLTLTPSIDASAAGHWHGFVQDGVIK